MSALAGEPPLLTSNGGAGLSVFGPAPGGLRLSRRHGRDGRSRLQAHRAYRGEDPHQAVIAVETTLEEAAEVGEEAQRRGLTITNVYGAGLAEESPEGLRKLIDNCQAARAQSVLLSGIGSEQTYEACCRTVAECCDYAAEKRIAVVLKPHGGMTGTGPQIRDAAKRVNRANFTVMYDPGNIYYYSQGRIDPVEDVKAVAGLVTGVSVKDYLPPDKRGSPPGPARWIFPRCSRSSAAADWRADR